MGVLSQEYGMRNYLIAFSLLGAGHIAIIMMTHQHKLRTINIEAGSSIYDEIVCALDKSGLGDGDKSKIIDFVTNGENTEYGILHLIKELEVKKDALNEHNNR